MGGQRRLRARRQPLRRQHRWRRLLADAPRASSAGSSSAPTRSGPRRRSTRPATASGARSTSTRSRSTPAARQRWQTANAGYVTSSPALGSDGTVYYGSFDGSLHAADPDTGADRWTFPTADHIYSSPALARDGQGRTSAVYIGSADGSVYAVRPDGSQLWRYDTGEPVRSSPVVGRAPKGDGQIVYVGSSNGKLYALDAESGRRRWSFDTTPSRPPLSDRNDLNGSPALGRRGVYIGGEHGFVWYVPYDYCLHRNHRRCERSPGQEFAADVERVLPVTPGGHHARASATSGCRPRPCSARGWSSAAVGRPSTRGCSHPRARTRWSRSSRRSTSRPSSPGTAITCSSARTASLPATPSTASTSEASGRRRRRAGASTTPCASTPSRRGASSG